MHTPLLKSGTWTQDHDFQEESTDSMDFKARAKKNVQFSGCSSWLKESVL